MPDLRHSLISCSFAEVFRDAERMSHKARSQVRPGQIFLPGQLRKPLTRLLTLSLGCRLRHGDIAIWLNGANSSTNIGAAKADTGLTVGGI